MKICFIYICLLLPLVGLSQLGGTSVYEFINTPYSAQENALGGTCISLANQDVAFALKNPSLLDSSYAHTFSANWGGIHIAQTNIGLGSMAYALPINPGITGLIGLQFVNYGRFYGYDENGNSTGTFFASDYQMIFGVSYELTNNFYAGVSFKPILSYIESYNSFGILGDAGITYKSTDRLRSAAITLRNIGTQLKFYTAETKEDIPYSIDIGTSLRLRHAPFRFTVTYRDLQKFDLQYKNSLKQEINLINQPSDSKENTFTTIRTNFMKHIQISTEILAMQKLHLLVGFNYRKSEEMSFGTTKRGVGLSMGFTSKLTYFDIGYGWAKQYVGEGTHYVSITSDIHKLYTHFIK